MSPLNRASSMENATSAVYQASRESVQQYEYQHAVRVSHTWRFGHPRTEQLGLLCVTNYLIVIFIMHASVLPAALV